MITHTFTLLSGVECEVKELTGEHQDMFTRKNKPIDFFDQILADIVVRIGSVKTISKEFCSTLLTPDRNQILFETRQFSLDYPEFFEGSIEYKNENGKQVTDNYRFDFKEIKQKAFPKQYAEYEEVIENSVHDLTVKGFDGKIRITLPNGKSEIRIQNKYKGNFGSNMQIDLYNPLVVKKDSEGKEMIPYTLNFKTISLKSIEDLRQQIAALMGEFDATASIELPTGETKKVNIMGDANFFFPSGTFS